MKISTEHIFPPIPLRQYDWLAYVDPEFGPFGHGATEAEAIADLEENAPSDAHQVNCLECGKPMHYTAGTCPHCGRVEFTNSTPDVRTSESVTTALVHGLVVDEVLALATNEGQNSSNGWRLREHFNHGLDNLAHRVEGVLIRNNVVEAA